MNIKNINGNFKADNKPQLYLTNTDYEFNYTYVNIINKKTNIYTLLQNKYKKSHIIFIILYDNHNI